jgi:hypothetical protein
LLTQAAGSSGNRSFVCFFQGEFVEVYISGHVKTTINGAGDFGGEVYDSHIFKNDFRWC